MLSSVCKGSPKRFASSVNFGPRGLVATAAAAARHGAKQAGVGLFVRQGESMFAALGDQVTATAIVTPRSWLRHRMQLLSSGDAMAQTA
jgi:hypothetical protein